MSAMLIVAGLITDKTTRSNAPQFDLISDVRPTGWELVLRDSVIANAALLLWGIAVARRFIVPRRAAIRWRIWRYIIPCGKRTSRRCSVEWLPRRSVFLQCF